MKTTKTYLNDAHDIVPAGDATWFVETQYDETGNVQRERWYKVVQPKRRPARKRAASKRRR